MLSMYLTCKKSAGINLFYFSETECMWEWFYYCLIIIVLGLHGIVCNLQKRSYSILIACMYLTTHNLYCKTLKFCPNLAHAILLGVIWKMIGLEHKELRIRTLFEDLVSLILSMHPISYGYYSF